MNRPSPFTFLLGNPVSLLAFWLLTAFLAYQWYANGASGLLPIIVGIGALSASNAYRRVEAYRLWKREWDAMDGKPASKPWLTGVLRGTMMKIIVGGGIWCAFAYAALKASNQPGMQIVAGMFWLGTLLLVGGGIYRLVRRGSPTKAKAEAMRDVPVTQCLRTPTQSPDLEHAFAALPDYCVPLLERSHRA